MAQVFQLGSSCQFVLSPFVAQMVATTFRVTGAVDRPGRCAAEMYSARHDASCASARGGKSRCSHRASYESELEAQVLATRHILEAARRCRAEASGLELEASAAARSVREDGRKFEALTANLASVRSTEQALAAEKRELCRRIQASTLALGVQEARAKAFATAEATR